MSITRRKFVVASGIVAAGVALGQVGCSSAEQTAASSAASSSASSAAEPSSASAALADASASSSAQQAASGAGAAGAAVPADFPAGTLLATEYAGNAIVACDPVSLEVLGRVPTGMNPAFLTCAGSAVYATISGGGGVLKVPIGDCAAAQTIEVGSQPLAICSDPTGATVFAADYSSSIISVVDTALGSMVSNIEMDRTGFHNRTDPPDCCRIYPGVGRRPVAMFAAPEGDTIYTLNYGTYDISCIDASTGEELSMFDGVVGPRKGMVSADRQFLYAAGVGGENEDKVSDLLVVDREGGKRAADVPVGVGVAGVAQSPDGGRVYAIARDEGAVVSFDPNMWNEVVRAQLPAGIESLTCSPDGTRLFVGNAQTGELFVLDADSLEILASASGIAGPKDLLVVPEVNA